MSSNFYDDDFDNSIDTAKSLYEDIVGIADDLEEQVKELQDSTDLYFDLLNRVRDLCLTDEENNPILANIVTMVEKEV